MARENQDRFVDHSTVDQVYLYRIHFRRMDTSATNLLKWQAHIACNRFLPSWSRTLIVLWLIFVMFGMTEPNGLLNGFGVWHAINVTQVNKIIISIFTCFSFISQLPIWSLFRLYNHQWSSLRVKAVRKREIKET